VGIVLDTPLLIVAERGRVRIEALLLMIPLLPAGLRLLNTAEFLS